nr:PDZ domain-containing protein [Desulforamulus aquiferis]
MAAMFSPLGHEMVIYIGKKLEFGRSIYQPPNKGVKVLDVVPGYPAWEAGIRSGDIIIDVNEMEVNSRQGLEFALGVYQQPQITYWSAKMIGF